MALNILKNKGKSRISRSNAVSSCAEYGGWGALTCLLALLLVACAHGPAPHGQSGGGSGTDVPATAAAELGFALIDSRLVDRNALWAPLGEALAEFTEADYQALAPLVLEQPLHALQAEVAAGRLSYESLTTFYLYRIRAMESDREQALNAVISLNPAALERARELDRAYEPGAGPLFGMPVLLKDNIGVAGMATTAGAAALRENFAADAFITARLGEAGAIILGKANLSEWAYFFCGECPSGYSAVGGQTLNPYGRFAFGSGGSSSGTGAAIAANYAAAGVGTETSGSILSPASANSLVGLKPTVGRLSRRGIVPISARLDTPGPMARRVADAVALFNAMTGYDDHDATLSPELAETRLEYRQVPLRGRRLGVLAAYRQQPEYAEALRALAAAGAVVVAVELPELDLARFLELLGGDMKRDLPAYLANQAAPGLPVKDLASLRDFNNQDIERRAPYGQALLDMMLALDMTDGELADLAATLHARAREALDALFSRHGLDALLSVNNGHAAVAALANYPALTVPMAYTEAGEPLGLTLLAPPYQEQVLVDIGAAWEALTAARRPPW